MQRHLDPLLTALLDRRRPVLAAFGLLALLLAPGLTLLESDNSPQVYFLKGDPAVERYRDFQRLFGSDQAVRVVIAGEGLWTPRGLAWLAAAEEAVAAVPGVSQALGPIGLADPAGLPDLQAGGSPAGSSLPEEARRAIVGEPLVRQLGLIGEGGETVTILALTETVLADRGEERLLADLDAALTAAGGPPPGVGATLAGMPVLDQALDGSSREIERRFFPLLVLFAALLLWVAFRSLAATAAPLAFVGFCQLAVAGPMGYLGVRLNLVLAVLPPLLFVISLATAVHLQMAYRRWLAEGAGGEGDGETGDDGAAGWRRALLATYRDKGWAVLWTGLTTLIAFAALAVSRVGPVRSLGLWCGAGILTMTVAAFTLYPLLLASWLRPRGAGTVRAAGAAVPRRPARLPALGRRLAGWSWRWRRPVLAAALLLALAAAGLPRLTVESNALRYLAADHPVRRGIEELERRGIGVAVVEVVLRRPAGAAGEGSLSAPEALAAQRELGERLRAHPLVLGAVGAPDLLDAAARRGLFDGGFLPPGPAAGGAALDGTALLDRFLADEGRAARLTLFTPTVGYVRLEPLLDEVRAGAAELLPATEVEITGQYPLLLATQRQLLSTLGLSLGLTLLAVAAILRLVLGTTRLTLLAMLPNLAPVLGVLGGMAWLGLPLDIATVMVASVILGLAVDDTLHTLGHFREDAPRLGRAKAVTLALEHNLAAYLLTGLILAAGFGVCALSAFAPTARFGILSTAGIALAVLGDCTLLPALLGSAPEGAIRKLGGGRAPSA